MADYSKLKVAELKELLKERSIPLTGLTKKQQFIDTLEEDDNANAESDVSDTKVKSAVQTSKKRPLSRSPTPTNVSSDHQPKKAKPAADQPKVADAQFATSSNLHIPVDEGCTLASYRVYVDSSSGIIYDASLNQTNASNNNNKFYRVQLLQGPNGDYKTWTRWGRVGEHGQNAVLGNGNLADAIKNFEKKFKDKSGLKWEDRGQDPKPSKYVFVERSYLPDSDEDEPQAKPGAALEKSDYVPPKCSLQPPVRSLLELIFNQQYFAATMDSLNYDADKLPLGKLSKGTITRGFQALKNLSAILDDASAAQDYEMSVIGATEHLSNLYYSLIPHAFGRNRPPVIRSYDVLKREIELLESLSELKDAHNIIKAEKDGFEQIHPLDFRFQGLGMQEMTPLSQNSNEFSEISQYLVKTRGETHNVNYTVEDIFRIERQGESDRFQESGYGRMLDGDRRLLWHGSRATNFGGILGQGLRIAPPEAPCSGYMFDKGIYLADMSSKSANYCYPSISGGHAVLLLCEAELGKPMQTLKQAKYNAGEEAKKLGVHSTWGQGRVGPKGWKDANCVHPSLAGVKMPDTSEMPGLTDVENAALYYNEYICYDVAQVRLRYLLRVRM